ncbi:hypothetical protein DRQ05_02735 [bacterium]|nr:MAG: hypothetical protein DRQ05_02735 [bacterium]
MVNIEEWAKDIEFDRMQKDRFFATHWQSPIPEKDRPKFKKLSYYPSDPAYRFELELHEHEEKKGLKIEDTAGNVRDFLRWGEFRFEIDGKPCTLQAYKDDPNEERLFIPFKDLTNGKETYGAGRYIDLEYMHDQTSDGKWILDFNRAYNPWCAYSPYFACPFVPPENWLQVEIKAGEKDYVLE